MAGFGKLIGMSKGQFAVEMGVSRNAVRQRVNRGALAEALHPDGSLDPVKARVAWFANVNPAKVRASKPEGEEDEPDKKTEYDLKVRRMAVDLEAAEISLEKLKDSTVDKSEARKAARSLMQVFRAAMLNFANRHAADIAAEIDADPVLLAGVLEQKMRVALGELSKTRAPYEAGTFGETE